MWLCLILFFPTELVLKIAAGVKQIRLPIGEGISGTVAKEVSKCVHLHSL